MSGPGHTKEHDYEPREGGDEGHQARLHRRAATDGLLPRPRGHCGILRYNSSSRPVISRSTAWGFQGVLLLLLRRLRTYCTWALVRACQGGVTS